MIINFDGPKRVMYLVRHGHFDVMARPADGLEGGLTALGRKQARLTAKRLSRLPITALYHSDLRRAAETAAIIAEKFPGVPVHASRLLRECIPGVPANQAEHFAHLPAERLQHEERQAERAYERFFKLSRRGDQHEIIVCHGNLIRYFLCRVLESPPGAWGRMDVRQGSLSEVVLQPGWCRVNSLSDVGHLPPALWTYF